MKTVAEFSVTRHRILDSRLNLVDALPVARALDRRLGIDLASLKGSGRDGAITLDVLRHSELATAQRTKSPVPEPARQRGRCARRGA